MLFFTFSLAYTVIWFNRIEMPISFVVYRKTYVQGRRAIRVLRLSARTNTRLHVQSRIKLLSLLIFVVCCSCWRLLWDFSSLFLSCCYCCRFYLVLLSHNSSLVEFIFIYLFTFFTFSYNKLLIKIRSKFIFILFIFGFKCGSFV